jgi:hypothetical protein
MIHRNLLKNRRRIEMGTENCGNCQYWNKETNFVGGCRYINMNILVQNPIPEAEDFSSANQLLVRKEFKCNNYKFTE